MHSSFYIFNFLYILSEQQEYKAISLDSPKNKKLQFHFNAKSPFKYDSSDNENDDKEIDLETEQSLGVPKKTNKFFFGTDDPRFNGMRNVKRISSNKKIIALQSSIFRKF